MCIFVSHGLQDIQMEVSNIHYILHIGLYIGIEIFRIQRYTYF